MRRSQIYLSTEQWRLLSALSRQMHKSVSELIRQALDRVYKRDESLDFENALQQMAGLWQGRKDLPPTRAYIRRLRRGARLKRLYSPRGHA